MSSLSQSKARPERDGAPAVFAPIFDLRSQMVIGYEALVAAAPRCADERCEVAGDEELAARTAALDAAAAAGLTRPLSLFLDVEPCTFARIHPEPLRAPFPVSVELSASRLTECPDDLLRALSAMRSTGWGVVLDDVGCDVRSLALMSMFYPDVLKLDLHRLATRDPAEVGHVVTAVGREAESRHATVLAKGIDTAEQLELARAYGASLGQGALLGAPGPLPMPLPVSGRELRLSTGAIGDPFGPTPWERVSNWRRAIHGPPGYVLRAVNTILDHGATFGQSAAVLASVGDASLAPMIAERYANLSSRFGFVGVLGLPVGTLPGMRTGVMAADDELREADTLVVLTPDFAACLVARPAGQEWRFAVTYDRDTVVECGVSLLARIGAESG